MFFWQENQEKFQKFSNFKISYISELRTRMRAILLKFRPVPKLKIYSSFCFRRKHEKRILHQFFVILNYFLFLGIANLYDVHVSVCGIKRPQANVFAQFSS